MLAYKYKGYRVSGGREYQYPCSIAHVRLWDVEVVILDNLL